MTRERSKVVTSCIYPVEQECEVLTNSDRIREERAMLLVLLQARAPEATAIAELAASYGTQVPSSFVTIDQEKCILCGLCMQACESLGAGAISTLLCGTNKIVGTLYARSSSDCIGCCSCAEICPTDAIAWQQNGETLTRTIWKREFELVSCERCGEIMGTHEELAWAAEKAGVEPATCCDRCRKHGIGDALLQTYGR